MEAAQSLSGDRFDAVNLTRIFEFHRHANDGVRQWVNEKLSSAVSALNLGLSLAIGLVTGHLMIFGAGPDPVAEIGLAIVVLLVLGAWYQMRRRALLMMRLQIVVAAGTDEADEGGAADND
jgi:hypothetical protein